MNIYVVIEGYDYEGEEVIGVFDNEEYAIRNIDHWKIEKLRDFELTEILPRGFKFGSNYRIYQEFELNELEEERC